MQKRWVVLISFTMDASGEHGSGVVLDFADSVAAISTPIDDPLQLVLPDSADPAEGKSIWKCKADNGIEVTMHDIRHVHKLQEYHGCYALEFRRPKSLWPKKPRQPFNDQGFLRCFCEFGKCELNPMKQNNILNISQSCPRNHHPPVSLSDAGRTLCYKLGG